MTAVLAWNSCFNAGVVRCYRRFLSPLFDGAMKAAELEAAFTAMQELRAAQLVSLSTAFARHSDASSPAAVVASMHVLPRLRGEGKAPLQPSTAAWHYKASHVLSQGWAPYHIVVQPCRASCRLTLKQKAPAPSNAALHHRQLLQRLQHTHDRLQRTLQVRCTGPVPFDVAHFLSPFGVTQLSPASVTALLQLSLSVPDNPQAVEVAINAYCRAKALSKVHC